MYKNIFNIDYIYIWNVIAKKVEDVSQCKFHVIHTNFLLKHVIPIRAVKKNNFSLVIQITSVTADLHAVGGTLCQGIFYEEPQQIRVAGAYIALPLVFQFDSFTGAEDLQSIQLQLSRMAPLLQSKFLRQSKLQKVIGPVNFNAYLGKIQLRIRNIATTLTKVQWEVDNQNSMSVEKPESRKKRGFINLMGEVSKTLFGTATDSDLSDVRNLVNKLTAKVEDQEFITDHILAATKSAFEKLNESVKSVVQHVNHMTKFIDTLAMSFQHFTDFSLLLDNLSLLATDLRTNVISFKASLALLDSGVLDPSLFPPEIMTKIVNKLKTIGYNVPSSPTYSHNQLFDIIKVKTTHIEYNSIQVTVFMPILENSLFLLHRVHSVHTFITETVTATWQTWPYLVSTMTGGTATHLRQQPACTQGVCYGSLILEDPANTCAASVLILNSTEPCQRDITKQSSGSVFSRIPSGYFYSLAPQKTMSLRQNCVNGSTTIHLSGNGFLPALAGCSYTAPSLYLSASGIVNVEGLHPISLQAPYALTRPVVQVDNSVLSEDMLSPLLVEDIPVPETQLQALHQLSTLPSGHSWRASAYSGLSVSTFSAVLVVATVIVSTVVYCKIRRRFPPMPDPSSAGRSIGLALRSLRADHSPENPRHLGMGFEEPSLEPHIYSSVAASFQRLQHAT